LNICLSNSLWNVLRLKFFPQQLITKHFCRIESGEVNWKARNIFWIIFYNNFTIPIKLKKVFLESNTKQCFISQGIGNGYFVSNLKKIQSLNTAEPELVNHLSAEKNKYLQLNHVLKFWRIAFCSKISSLRRNKKRLASFQDVNQY